MRALVAIAVLCGAASARADVDDETASRLYDEAQDDFVAGRFAAACPKLESSVRLRPELKPLGLLAACHEKQGKLATAWRTFKEVRRRAEEAGNTDLAVAAAGHVARLEPQLARLTIALTTRTDGLVVTLAGRTLLANELGTPFEIDAGTYQIIATAPGHTSWQHEVGMRDGKAERIEVPALIAPALPERIKVAPMRAPPPAPSNKRRLVAFGVLGAGGVAFVVGGLFGLAARTSWNDAHARVCNANGLCTTPEGVHLIDDANSQATLSTVLVGAGVALALTGTVLWLTAPKRERKTTAIAPTVDRRAAGVVVQGRF